MKFKAVKSGVIAFGLLGLSGLAVANDDYKDAANAFDASYQNDYVAASKLWQKLAEKGIPDAQFNLGLMYHSGAAGVFSEKQALKWYLKAAQNGSYQAQEYMAVGYREGWFGLKKDTAKAKHWETRLNP